MIEALKKFEEVIETYIRPATLPVALKLLRSEQESPKGIERAQKALGHMVALCQGFGLARHNRQSLTMLKDDITCPTPIIALGLGEPPELWLKGELYKDWYTPSPQAAEKLASEMHRFPVGKYVGVTVAPINTCDFEPDLVIVFCNPLQSLTLIQASLVQEGGRFTNSMWPAGACTNAIVPTILTGRCQFTIPCAGDRKWESTSADEVIFAVPSGRLEEITSGLKYFFEHGHEMLVSRYLDFEPVHLETYRKLRDML